jgi:hypothetical protein
MIVTLASARQKHLSGFPCRDVGETLDLSQWRATSEGMSFSKWGASRQRRKAMKQMSPTTIAIAASTFGCAALLSFNWSEQRGISLSVESAQARVGRPLTPVSVAGVARRQNRRAVYGAGVGAAAVGTAAAIGTAGAVAATSPDWGWGADPYQTRAGYYAGGPYYGGSVRGARAAYYGGGSPSAAPAASTGPQPHQGVRAYYAGGPWYGYSGWDDYKTRNGIKCTPGTMTKLDDGQMYVCQ